MGSEGRELYNFATTVVKYYAIIPVMWAGRLFEGRDCDAAALLKEHEKVFLLLDSSMNLRQICQILKDADMGNTRIYAGVRMGYEDERKIYGTAEEMTDIETNSLTAVFLEREKDER